MKRTRIIAIATALAVLALSTLIAMADDKPVTPKPTTGCSPGCAATCTGANQGGMAPA